MMSLRLEKEAEGANYDCFYRDRCFGYHHYYSYQLEETPKSCTIY